MKGVFLISLSLLSYACPAQTKADYEHAVKKLVQFYNHNKVDSVYKLLSDSWGDDKKTLYNANIAKGLKKKYGRITSYKYIGKDEEYYDELLNPMVFFRVAYTKLADGRKEHAMSISLDEHNKIYGFNFVTSSPHIDSLVFKK